MDGLALPDSNRFLPLMARRLAGCEQLLYASAARASNQLMAITS